MFASRASRGQKQYWVSPSCESSSVLQRQRLGSRSTSAGTTFVTRIQHFLRANRTAAVTMCEWGLGGNAAASGPEPPEAAGQATDASNCDCSAAAASKRDYSRFRWKFKWPICQFLDQSPMTFKELHTAIAQRHAKHCTGVANGKIVSLANVRSLKELERDLLKVAINRDGVWHLKDGISEKMPAHGTRTRYSRYGCSCSECRAAYSRYRHDKFERTGTPSSASWAGPTL